MNLKTAFRYQNFLTQLANTALIALDKVRIVQTETHQKSLVNPDVADEVVIAENNDITKGVTAEKCIALIFDIYLEREKLDREISRAKRFSEFDFDAELNTNKARRNLISRLNYLTGLSDSEKTVKGTDYKFNVEGNQTSYTYPVKVVTELTYDKDALAEKIKELSAQADCISDMADEFVIVTLIDIEPKFDIHDKFDNIIKYY